MQLSPAQGAANRNCWPTAPPSGYMLKLKLKLQAPYGRFQMEAWNGSDGREFQLKFGVIEATAGAGKEAWEKGATAGKEAWEKGATAEACRAASFSVQQLTLARLG